MRLLIVEQDQAIRDLLRYALELEGYDVEVVNGWAELEAVVTFSSDLDGVVSDVVLARDTRQAEVIAAAEARGIPVLLMTGDTDTMLELDQRGPDYLKKPFQIEQLLGWVKAHSRV